MPGGQRSSDHYGPKRGELQRCRVYQFPARIFAITGESAVGSGMVVPLAGRSANLQRQGFAAGPSCVPVTEPIRAGVDPLFWYEAQDRPMIDLKRILAATDFSQHSQVALRYAAALAKAFSAEVVLCHVLENPDFLSQLPPVAEGYFPPNLAEIQEKHARVQCEQVLAAEGLSQARVLLRHGTPSVELVQAAKDEHADLIIVGTHGRGAIAHLLLGSVAEKVVRAASCPVLTVRSGEHEFVKS